MRKLTGTLLMLSMIRGCADSIVTSFAIPASETFVTSTLISNGIPPITTYGIV